MTFDDVARMLNPGVYRQFKESLALGKWPDGREMTREQKEICLQAVILYEQQQGLDESARTGFVDTERKQKQPAGSKASGKPDDQDSDTIRILH